eukprot:389048-Prymnesium_polylepis.1
MARLTYVRDKVVAGKWDKVHGQTLRCEGLPDSTCTRGTACDTHGRSLPSVSLPRMALPTLSRHSAQNVRR